MKNTFPYTLIVPLLLLIATTVMIYPYFQYYVDPDAVAYLTISKRYAAGDTWTAVNGYWSPWSCWLTALFIKQGLEAFKAAILVNAIGASGCLIASVVLFARFISDRLTIMALSATLALFLSYTIFKQSFADLWYIFFLMVVLILMIHRNFLKAPWMWVAAGALGSLAYYAKAYAFPYFILSILVVVAIRIRREYAAFNYKRWLLVSGVVVCIMFFFSFPWLWLLHEKYGKWMTSSAGSLNLSWYLVGHPYFKEGIGLLIPPVYPDAVYYWEDPYLVNGPAPHFWNSPKLLLMQLVRGGYTMLKLVNSMNELSAFFLLITLFCVAAVFSKKLRQFFPADLYILCVVFLLFPLGYLLINFESRYLWFLVPVSMVVGALLINKTGFILQSGRLRSGLLMVFCISFLVFPVWDMKTLFRAGEKEFLLARQLKQAGIKGSFASNVSELEPLQAVIRMAYFSGNSFYYMPWMPQRQSDLLKELRQYHVKYYFHFHEPFDGVNIRCKDENGLPLPVVFEDTVLSGLRVYQLNP